MFVWASRTRRRRSSQTFAGIPWWPGKRPVRSAPRFGYVSLGTDATALSTVSARSRISRRMFGSAPSATRWSKASFESPSKKRTQTDGRSFAPAAPTAVSTRERTEQPARAAPNAAARAAERAGEDARRTREGYRRGPGRPPQTAERLERDAV